MAQEITINYTEGQDVYRVILAVNDSPVLNEASIPADIKGEKRVAAIVAAGGVKEIGRVKNGAWHDGPDGQPAFQRFNDDGTLYRTTHHQQVTINYGEGKDAYQVTLTGEGSLVFNNASIPADIKGEDRIAAIFAAGGVSYIERKKDGTFDDGPNGEPARQSFNKSGMPSFIERYQNGKKNDGLNGEPCAEIFYWNSGKPASVSRHKDDINTDGANGEPAYKKFNEDGILIHKEFLSDGKLNDGPNGEPALQSFDYTGKLCLIAHYKDGKRVKRLSNVKRKLSSVLKKG